MNAAEAIEVLRALPPDVEVVVEGVEFMRGMFAPVTFELREAGYDLRPVILVEGDWERGRA